MKTLVAELEYEGQRYTVTRDEDENADYLDPADPTRNLESLVWYMWTEGNYSCDCNRLMFMGLADLDDTACGEKVNLLSLTLDGKTIV